MTKGTKVIGYVRVSTDEQGNLGAGLEAQRQAIEERCRQRGWELVAVFEDVASGKSRNGRQGLEKALEAVRSGEASALIVAKLDRLSRSLVDFATLIERSRKEGWQLVALDLDIDTTTPTGEMLANIVASLAQWERRIIGQRTRDALAVKRAQGVELGRPRTLADDVRKRIRRMRSSGKTLQQIADALNTDGVPTAHGGARWHRSTIAAVLRK